MRGALSVLYRWHLLVSDPFQQTKSDCQFSPITTVKKTWAIFHIIPPNWIPTHTTSQCHGWFLSRSFVVERIDLKSLVLICMLLEWQFAACSSSSSFFSTFFRLWLLFSFLFGFEYHWKWFPHIYLPSIKTNKTKKESITYYAIIVRYFWKDLTNEVAFRHIRMTGQPRKIREWQYFFPQFFLFVLHPKRNLPHQYCRFPFNLIVY